MKVNRNDSDFQLTDPQVHEPTNRQPSVLHLYNMAHEFTSTYLQPGINISMIHFRNRIS